MLEWLEGTSVGLWMRESPSVWAFPTVLTLHTTGMAILVGASWLLDLRLLGISRNILRSQLKNFGLIGSTEGTEAGSEIRA